MPLTLIIDSSTERGLVALNQGPDVLWSEPLPFGYQSSHHLPIYLEKGFETLNIKPVDLQLIAASGGPGSFTGIRVGVSFAKGLAKALQIPLIGFNALKGFISPHEGVFVSFIDARSQGAFCLVQKREKGEIHLVSPSKLYSLVEIQDLEKEGAFFIGPNFQRLKLAHTLERAPDAAHLAKTVCEKWENSKRDELSSFAIDYLRSGI